MKYVETVSFRRDAARYPAEPVPHSDSMVCALCLTVAAIQEELTLAARRISVAPTRASNFQIRNTTTGRNGSMFWSKSPLEGIPYRFQICLILTHSFALSVTMVAIAAW